ncbi:hemicentin-1-like isoform X3 [Mya arenaria]|uniref:hemicentin-1-like isoform X3 n=1 Tax=Mya arenaria TaxID=6604 RepID=UPI0022E43078|nr:hemicentin-1-like isoform X3 [Mya arenaria]
MKRNMKTITCVCLLSLFKTFGSDSITLEVNKSNIEEKKQLTLTCSTQMPQAYIQFVYVSSNNSFTSAAYVLYNTTSGACIQYIVRDEVLFDCFCDNSKRYICHTKPLTRNNNGDGWFCFGANSIKSNVVYISIIVPIQSATILEDIQEVIDIQEGGLVRLTCESPFGIPAANITWFLDNKTRNAYDDDLEISLKLSASVKKNTDRTYNTTSSLSLNVSRNEDGEAVYCNASNSLSNVASSRKLILNVRYNPETSILINKNESYSDFYMIRNAPTIQRLQCDVRGGKPFATLTWSCYGGNQTNNNTSTGATSNITWISGIHNDSVCICKASHVLGWSDERKVSVHVLYPPSEPKCKIGTATIRSGPVNVSVASNFTMTCTSDANPEPTTFIWCFPNGNCTKRNILFIPSMQIENDGIYNLYIQNTMTPSIGDNMGGNRNATFSLRAHYHPKDVYFHFDNKNGICIRSTSIAVIKNDNVTLACVADGYPAPNYTWTGNTVGQLYHRAFIGDTEIVCNASNTLLPTGHEIIEQERITNAKLQVDVLYPSTRPNLQLLACSSMRVESGHYIKVIIGEALYINCSSSGNPPPTYFWSDGKHSSQFYITNVLRSHASEYFCTAHNTMNASYGKSISSSMTSSFYLDVLNPPKISNFRTIIEVPEGENFSLICNAEPGNPNVTSYFWTSLHQPDRNTSDQYLVIKNISRTKEGVYTCFAQNIMQPTGCPEIRGSDRESVYVDVKYKASIETFIAENTMVSHGNDLTFECCVDSDPPANITMLSPIGSVLIYITGSNQLHYTKKSSCLEDIGLFTCVSANKHNRMQPDIRSVIVDVKCPPMYPSAYRQSTTIKTIPGEKAILNFSVFSNPPPMFFIWTNSSSNLRIPFDTTTLNRVFINTTYTMSSSLIISSVEPWDYGNYSVMVQNEIGSMIETFLIVEDSKRFNTDPTKESSTSANSDSGTGTIVGGTVGTMCTVIVVTVLLAIFFYRKRQSRYESDRLRDEGTLNDETRYEYLAMGPTRTPTDYSDLDFQCRTEKSSKQTPFKDSDVYENLKLTSAKSSAST